MKICHEIPSPSSDLRTSVAISFLFAPNHQNSSDTKKIEKYLSKSEASGLIVSVILRVQGNGLPVHVRPRLVGPEGVAPPRPTWVPPPEDVEENLQGDAPQF